jgi:hypothetical protein
MPVPPEIGTIIDQLDRELDRIEQEATAGVSLIRSLLSRFPDNLRLIQFFTAFNNALLFVEISRRRIQATVDRLSAPDILDAEIQEAGEDLGTLMGRVIEVKIGGRRILSILEQM